MWDWIVEGIRALFVSLDKIIYGFVGTVYNLLIEIAQTSIFTEEIFNTFASKVYALLGVFMLFKVSFSILTYIVSPDDFLDKNKGFGKLISNILIVLVLLVTTPWIFRQAMEIQHIILKENVLGKIFTQNSTGQSIVTSSNPGMMMAYDTLSAFYYFDFNTYEACANLEDPENGLGKQAGLPDAIANCLKIKDADDGLNALNKSLYLADRTKNVNIYLNSFTAMAQDEDKNYVMNYTFLISTLAGGVLVLLLIVFCFDVGVRSVKLGFMRMIAPIPIIARLDPKKGKETFDKWYKNCLSTYLDLFIRLIGIYFAIFIVSNLSNMNFVDAATGLPSRSGFLVKVFIILGALMFAKQLPKLLEDLTGIKLGGKFTLNPLKKLGEVPLAGAAASGVAGAVTGAAGAFGAGKQLGHSAWKNIGHGFGGAFKGAAGGFKGGLKYDGKGSPLKAGRDAGKASAQKVYKNEDTTLGSRMAASVQQQFGMETEFDKLERQNKLFQAVADYKKTLKGYADFDTTNFLSDVAKYGEMDGFKDLAEYAKNNEGIRQASLKGTKALKEYYEDLKNSGTASLEEIQNARNAWEAAQKISISAGEQPQVKVTKEAYARLVNQNEEVFAGKGYPTKDTFSYSDMNNAFIDASTEVTKIQSSAEYKTAKASKEATAPKK